MILIEKIVRQKKHTDFLHYDLHITELCNETFPGADIGLPKNTAALLNFNEENPFSKQTGISLMLTSSTGE